MLPTVRFSRSEMVICDLPPDAEDKHNTSYFEPASK